MTSSTSLLFTLRSPTTPLEAKLALAQSTISSSPSQIISTQLRDWILDLFLKSLKQNSSILLNQSWWSLLLTSLTNATGSTTSPTLPTFINFLQSYSTSPVVSKVLVETVLGCWRKLAGGAMKKATVDAALDGYSALLKASVLVITRAGEDVKPWEELAELWMKSFRAVADSGKGGKKIPLHTLANLPSILQLLPLLQQEGPFFPALLQTIQFTLFNIDNLRRGIARETYNAGVAPAADESVSESASSELLNALKALTSTQGILGTSNFPYQILRWRLLTPLTTHLPPVYKSLPILFSLYRLSLQTHATILFPLPAKTSFPTASAYRSATELHSLQKRRALAAGWVRGVVSLIDWRSSSSNKDEEEEKTNSLAKTLEEVEKGDLFRESEREAWEGVLEGIVDGAVVKLVPSFPNSSLLNLLSSVARLSFDSFEPSLDTTLSILSTCPPSPSSSS
ncbi:hypothetical protein P7C70_g3696, partial [Phenoliferia sp. Uapishka_3]